MDITIWEEVNCVIQQYLRMNFLFSNVLINLIILLLSFFVNRIVMDGYFKEVLLKHRIEWSPAVSPVKSLEKKQLRRSVSILEALSRKLFGMFERRVWGEEWVS
jgi:hypothetical protein